jgi:RNA polymerase sigma-70 factor (sigma-E family)
MNRTLEHPAPAGDFSAFVAERRPALLRAARAIATDQHSAEDLLQAALTAVFTRWDGIRDPRAAEAYVRRTMVNQLISWRRQPWRTAERLTDDVPEPRPGGDLDRQPPWSTPQLWPRVARLPPRQRSVVVLRYYEELTEAETAAVLHCSVGTVKSSASRGLAALRRIVREADDFALAG